MKYILILVLIGIGIFFAYTKNNQATFLSEKVSQPKDNTIRIMNYAFSPTTMRIKKGTTITWINEDTAKHTVTSDNEKNDGPNSEFFGKGQSYAYTFTKAGTYSYHCQPHPYMKASVEVTE